MKRKIYASLVVFGLWLSGIVFGTFSIIPSPAPPAKIIEKDLTNRDSRNLAKTYVASGWGWQDSEWACLNRLWTAESKWDYKASNPRSSAYGVAQRLGEKSKVPAIQILRGARYISKRYGSPCRAWGHFQRRDWY